MAFQITDRPYDVATDRTPEGETWPFALMRGEETILADTAGDIISFLIDGYEDIPETPAGNDEALIVRAADAIRNAALVQAMMAYDAVNEGTFDVEAESEEVITAILGDRTIPVLVDRWEHEVPLVLITTDYEPFTNELAPTGNIVWLDPFDEVDYLKSLANLGLIQFYVHEDH